MENREQIEMELIDPNEDKDSKIGLNHKYEEQKQLLEKYNNVLKLEEIEKLEKELSTNSVYRSISFGRKKWHRKIYI